MTIWTYDQLLNLWRAAGGRQTTADVFAAVALAESGGDDLAVSYTGDYGLWQINARTWFGRIGRPTIGWGNWQVPAVNAAAAVAISGGWNCGPWCTCWADPARDCATGPLTYPQGGSAAWRVLHERGISGGGGGGGGGGPAAASTAGATAAWGNVQNFFGADARAMYARIGHVRAQARGYWADLIRKG